MQAATKAQDRAGRRRGGDRRGTIGIMVALAALAGGCARVIVTDLCRRSSTSSAATRASRTINSREKKLAEEVAKLTDSWGADVVFEASGNAKAYDGIFDLVRPGGCLVLVGMPVDPVPFDVVAACAKEARIETIFRYANVLRAGDRVDRFGQGRSEAADLWHLPVRGQHRGGGARGVRPAGRRQAADQNAVGDDRTRHGTDRRQPRANIPILKADRPSGFSQTGGPPFTSPLDLSAGAA